MIRLNPTKRTRIAIIPALITLIALAAAACGNSAPATNEDPATSTGVQAPAASPSPATVAPTAAIPVPGATEVPSVVVPSATALVPATDPTDVSNDGVFSVGSGSEATFTVNEKLSRLPLPNDAVLRTDDISGFIDPANGSASLVINLHALKSDQSRRDDYVRNRMFPNQPEATISITDFPEIPESFHTGESFSSTVVATVNINGTDADIEFAIEVRLDPDRLLVLVKGDFVWADFGMTAPNSRSFVVTDDVHVEVLISAFR